MPGFDPISIEKDTWSQASPDGSLLVIFKWDEAAQISHARVIDVERWRQVASFEHGPTSGLTIHEDWLYAYDYLSGQLSAIDLITGEESVLADWSPNHWLYEGPTLLPGSRMAALVAEPVATGDVAAYSVFVFDPATSETAEFPVGQLERVNPATGVFDGEREIPEVDYPGVAWGGDRLFLAYMDGPEVIEVDLATGAVQSHMIELSSWWNRLLASWVPAASAKGPSQGTNSSAALSPDGRFLFISGNKQMVTTDADGTLVEKSEHLGLVVVDTETWRSRAVPDLPIQYVFSAGVHVMGVNTTSFQPWTDDYYVLSMDQSGHPRATGPLTVTGGTCEQTADLEHLLCFEHASVIQVQLIEIDTLETIDRRAIGLEDTILPNGVLVDSLPRSDP